jgi:type VI secretion system protein ImpH
MAPPERPATHPLARLKRAAREEHLFVPFLSLVERLFPQATRIGTAARSIREPVRLKHDPSLSFSTSDISKVEIHENREDILDGAFVTLTSTFLGLTGSVSPLPAYFSEEVLHEPNDTAHRQAFLDIFHHRILSLFFRAATIANHPMQYGVGGRDEWSRRVLSLAGFTPDLPDSLPLPAWRLLRLTPLLMLRFRNADILRRAVQDFLDIDIPGTTAEVRLFMGSWVPLDKSQLIRLGQVNSTLGGDVRIGTRVYDESGAIRVIVRPVPFATSERLRPGRDLYRVLATTVALILRDRIDWDLEVVIAAGTTPTMRVSADGGAKLGQETWLGRHYQPERHVIHQGT